MPCVITDSYNNDQNVAKVTPSVNFCKNAKPTCPITKPQWINMLASTL